MPSYYFSDFYDAVTDTLSDNAPESLKQEFEDYHREQNETESGIVY